MRRHIVNIVSQLCNIITSCLQLYSYGNGFKKFNLIKVFTQVYTIIFGLATMQIAKCTHNTKQTPSPIKGRTTLAARVDQEFYGSIPDVPRLIVIIPDQGS